jgi:D-alanyl-D-alanine carboxypeptidase/D-alanyl-D-alanine-endopeptidase (penicillin-binding protein 4)
LLTLVGLALCALPLLGARAAPAVHGHAEAALPALVQAALDHAGIAESGSAFVVLPLDGGALALARHADTPMNPASTMKLLTTYAALDMLGPNYRWRTQVYTSRRPVAGRLDGDLIVRGEGDPSLVIERWWLLVQRIRALGIKDIRGDLVIDRSRYAPEAGAGPTIDGNDLRPYNVAPDALLINFKALALDFVPDPAAGVARIVATPQLDGVSIPAQVPLLAGPCADWKAALRADFSRPHALRFAGGFTASCDLRTWHLSLLTPDEYALASFRALWRAAGGSLRGTVREGIAGPGARMLTEVESAPLAQVIRDINKNSNNVMARQLFLTLGASADAAPAPDASAAADDGTAAGAGHGTAALAPASIERALRALHAWLDREGLKMPELVVQNGSGLSRVERISAASLGRLLVHAWNGPEMPNFLASLPQPGIDGTMKDRPAAAHAGFIKTGTLAEVSAVAGYVFAASGHRYAVVALVNDPHADNAQAAQDAFLQWVWKEG